MIIRSIEIFRTKIPLTKPFKTALRVVEACEDIIVRLRTEDGIIGFGSAAPTVAITGESHATIIESIRSHIAPKLIGFDLRDRHRAFSLVKSALDKNTSAKAAVDMALYDAWCKSQNLSLAHLLGGTHAPIVTDMTISMDSPQIMAQDARAALEKGFHALKIKVGSNIALDLERVSAVISETSGKMEYRIDANQAWTVEDAIQISKKMADFDVNIPFLEQPVQARDFEGMKKVRQASPLPIMADESCFSVGDAIKLAQMGACDLFNVKLMKTGSMNDAIKIIDLASEFGMSCMISSMLESRIGISCAAAVAAARTEVTYIDLDASHMQERDSFIGGVELDGPIIHLPEGLGHGISDISELIEI